MTTTEAPPITWPLPTEFKPRPYQLDALGRATTNHVVLDHGLGAGKSTTSLATLEALGCQRVLVLCPSKVLAVWRDELAENAARTWTVWAGEVRGQGGKKLKNPAVIKRVDAISDASMGAHRLGRPFMAVVNYESTHQAVMANALLGTPWDALICDESQHLAGAGAATSKFTKRLGDRVRARGGRIILCTGTFMPHSALSVYGQMRTLNPAVLGPSWPAFKARYAKWRVLRETAWCPGCMKAANTAYIGEMCGARRATDNSRVPVRCNEMIVRGDPVYHKTPRGDLIPDGVREDRRDELMARLRPWVHRVSQDELDAQTGLVEAVPQLRTTQLDPAARKAYDALKRDLIAQVADGTIVAANAMVAVGKLMMLTSGHYRDAGSGVITVFGQPGADTRALCPKARLLREELQETPGEPVVVFYQYRYDARQINAVCDELGLRYGELSGQRTDGLDGKFMAPGIDVLGVQWQSGSEGINLSRSHTQIDYSLTFKLTAFQQAGRRLNRQGQTHAVTRRVLACEDTIDVGCFHALKRRQMTNDSILRLLGD